MTDTDTDALLWTGHNVDEMESFVRGSGFGFAVDSCYHNYRWWHRVYQRVTVKLPYRLFARLPEWEPPEDPTVLEIYPVNPAGEPFGHWTTARPGDVIHRDGTVTRETW